MLISIITVCYNSSATIAQTIASVNNQAYQKIEHIFVDGDSFDNTVDIINKTSQRSPIIVSEKDSGIYNAMNKGLSLAKGRIIGFLNADDIFCNDQVICSIASSFTANIDCVYGNLIFVDKKEKVIRKWVSNEFRPGIFKYSWTPAHPTFYCKKSIYDELGNYREDFSIASDVDLMFRFLEIHRIKSRFLNKYLVKMKVGGVSTKSFKSTLVISKEVFTSFKEYGYKYNYPVYITGKIIKAFKQLL
jgi:glycosyltransferase involved in cell wall biosynthesis